MSALSDPFHLDHVRPIGPRAQALAPYVLDSLVPQLFSLGLTLSGALSFIESGTAPLVESKIHEAITDLDDAIKTLRAAALEDHLRNRPPGAMTEYALSQVERPGSGGEPILSPVAEALGLPYFEELDI